MVAGVHGDPSLNAMDAVLRDTRSGLAELGRLGPSRADDSCRGRARPGAVVVAPVYTGRPATVSLGLSRVCGSGATAFGHSVTGGDALDRPIPEHAARAGGSQSGGLPLAA